MVVRPGKDIFKIIADGERFADSLQIDDYAYSFSSSCKKPTLYSSVYACMIKGWRSSFNTLEKQEWGEYLNSFQRPDGFYVDPICLSDHYFDGDGWGARHLIPHMIIALNRLNAKPKYEFSFINRLRFPDDMNHFLKSLDYHNIWGTSNIIMNYGVTMQYARDYMGLPFQDSITCLEDWLVSHIRKDCGMWQIGSIDHPNMLYETIRGAYHLYPILLYDKIQIPYYDKVIPFLLRAQNRQGGFDSLKNSTACDDIDAIDPLVRCSVSNNVDSKLLIKIAVQRAKRNVLRNQNSDGGFVFSRRGPFSYGGMIQLSSRLGESNLFGTWFRILSLLYIQEFLGTSTGVLQHFPGYELSISK